MENKGKTTKQSTIKRIFTGTVVSDKMDKTIVLKLNAPKFTLSIRNVL